MEQGKQIGYFVHGVCVNIDCLFEQRGVEEIVVVCQEIYWLFGWRISFIVFEEEQGVEHDKCMNRFSGVD